MGGAKAGNEEEQAAREKNVKLGQRQCWRDKQVGRWIFEEHEGVVS